MTPAVNAELRRVGRGKAGLGGGIRRRAGEGLGRLIEVACGVDIGAHVGDTVFDRTGDGSGTRGDGGDAGFAVILGFLGKGLFPLNAHASLEFHFCFSFDLGFSACGALTGGLMALSCKRGRERDDFAKGKYITHFKHGQKLIERFKTEFASVTSQELQQQFTGKTFDLWNAKEYAQFDREREHQCAHASAMVGKWVVELL